VAKSTWLYQRMRGHAGRRALCELVQRFSKVTEFIWGDGTRMNDFAGAALLEHLPHLTTMGVAHTFLPHCRVRFGGWLVDLGTRCPNLRSLCAENCVGGPFPHLTHLTLYGVQGKDRLAHIARSCPRLESIRLSSYYVRRNDHLSSLANFVTSLSQLPCLTTIHLNGTRLDDAFIFVVAMACPLVRDVAFQESMNVTTLGVTHVATRMHHVERVNFDECTHVGSESVSLLAHALGEQLIAISFGAMFPTTATDAGMSALGLWCPNLLEATFRHANGITSVGVKALAEGCPRLTRVAITSCAQLTDEGVVAVASSCSNLQVAEFHHCPLLTDNAVVAIAERCHNVASIAFAGCPLITDRSVLAVAEHCPVLTIFAFQRCPLLTDDGVCALRHCPHLRTVYVSACPLVTALSGRTLVQHCRQLCRRLHGKECNVEIPGVRRLQSLADRIAMERR
jgi:hypothetical protein